MLFSSMIAWIILIAAVLGILLIAKFAHFKHRLGIILMMALLLFFYLTFTIVTSANGISLKTASGLFTGFKVYFLWMGHIFDNLKVLTTNAIRMDWAGNSTG